MPKARASAKQMVSKPKNVWTENELKSVFKLYLNLGGKALHEKNPAIINLGKKLGRPTRTVEYQLLMFRNLERNGAYGVGKMNTLCKKIWKEYQEVGFGLVKNENKESMYPFAFESWKSASAGGVRRPFDETTGRPTSKRIETAITTKLEAIVKDKEFPKAIFLVGGPGNGKTDTLEQLVRLIDEYYTLNEKLIKEAEKQFSTYKRKVIIDVKLINKRLPFKEVHLVQDASERENNRTNAAESLLKDLDLILNGKFNGIYICCVNRGILDNLRRLSLKRKGLHIDYIKDLHLAVSPSLPSLVLSSEKTVNIWPLEESFTAGGKDFIRTFIWPMDVDSLFLPTSKKNTPFLDLLNIALDKKKWQFEDEDLRFKPASENYQLLQEEQAQLGLLRYLRTYELLAGIRFTFRDLLSFIAYIFHCNSYEDITAQNDQIVNGRSFIAKFNALHNLFAQLYFVKLFPWQVDKKNRYDLLQRFKELKSQESWNNDAFSALECLKIILTERTYYEGSYIERIILNEQFRELDPARSLSELTIPESTVKFSEIDQLFSRGISIGLEKIAHVLTPLELEYIGMLKDIEEKSLNGNDVDRKKSTYLPLCLGFFRKYVALLCKRSIGFKMGIINHFKATEDFVGAFHRPAALAELKEDLFKALFPDEKLKVSFCSGIGQPSESLAGDAYLNLGNLEKPDGLLKAQYKNLPNWDIVYLQLEKGKAKADLHLNFSTYLKVVKLSKMNVMPGCIPPDLLMWRDTIASTLSSFEIRDMSKLSGKVIELSNNTKINIDYNENFKFEVV